ncbi:MAG: ABC transporter permease [Candidatus Aminicenantes bacterium]
MLKNYLKVVLRNLRQQKFYSIIVMSGLVIGFTFFILGNLYVNFHFSFDQFHQDIERIYLLTRIIPSKNMDERHSFFIDSPVSPLIEQQFPEIEKAIRFIPLSRKIVRYKEKIFNEDKLYITDENFFDFFSLKLLKGNPTEVLKEPNSVVLTVTTAKKYFGDEEPIGKTIDFVVSNISLKVTGICEDIPPNSTLNYTCLVSAATYKGLDDWGVRSTLFVKLKQDTHKENLERSLPDFTKKYTPKYYNNNERLYLFPFKDIHLNSVGFITFLGEQTESKVQFHLILGVSVFLLLIVCINFMNLSTARYLSRAKEVGLRKTLGASRQQLIYQFLGEAILLSLIALPLAIICFEIVKSTFISIIGRNIPLNLLNNPFMLIIMLGVSFLVGVFSGSYPAFFLSKFKPAQVLKGKINTNIKGAVARKILVITQFSLSLIIIVPTMVSIDQFDFLMKKDLGYNRENVITIPVRETFYNRLEPLKIELLKYPKISHLSFANSLPIKWAHEVKVRSEGFLKENALIMKGYWVSYDFIETMGMKLINGRSFSRKFNDENNFVISKTAASALGWEKPIGKTLIVEDVHIKEKKGNVIGVLEDFHFNDVFHPLSPNILILEPKRIYTMFIKVNGTIDSDIVNYIQAKWQSIFPEVPFEYSTLDHIFSESYRGLIKSTETFKIVSMIAIFISCLGLIGLSSYTIERKTKEIGIRKTLGASVSQIINMFVGEFIKFVIIANLIALPIAYFIAHWLLNWAWVYRIKLGIIYFIIAALLSLFSAFISVIPQTVKAATVNPVESLKYE